MIKRKNAACKFFPCHKGLEDCTFCYCPFYPCLNYDEGSYIYSAKFKNGVWACHGCNWIHKKRTVDEIFSLIRSNYCRPAAASKGVSGAGIKTGIIILGHGTKLHKANKLIPELIEKIRQKTNYNIIEPSYLQFHHPDLPQSIRKIAGNGCKKIIIVPFFLFKGNHVKRDIPQVMKKEISKYPDVTFVFTPSMGEDSRIGDIVIRRINEAMTE